MNAQRLDAPAGRVGGGLCAAGKTAAQDGSAVNCLSAVPGNRFGKRRLAGRSGGGTAGRMPRPDKRGGRVCRPGEINREGESYESV